MRTPSCSDRLRRGLVLAALVLPSLMSGRARAGEESSWAFLGFSDDGGYAAVEVFGTRQEGDSPYSTIRIIDTKANQFVGPAITTCIGQGCEDAKNPNPTLKQARTRNRQKAHEALAQRGIDINNQGERSALWTKQRVVDQGLGTSGLARETADVKWLDSDWTIVLQEVAAPNGPASGYGRPRMIDLRLQRNGTELVLQKDKSIPKSRGVGIYSYELDTVITCRNAMLVVLRCWRPGRQGPDVTQMFVTAGST